MAAQPNHSSKKQYQILLGFVFVKMGIYLYQEKKTEKVLDALKNLASPRSLVIRDGSEKRIADREEVTDIILQEGDRVPADATVLTSVNLLADESLLTGESAPVRKNEGASLLEKVHPGSDDLPFVCSGSLIVQGNGLAAQETGDYRDFSLSPGDRGLYHVSRRFTERLSCGSGHVARGISHCP